MAKIYETVTEHEKLFNSNPITCFKNVKKKHNFNRDRFAERAIDSNRNECKRCGYIRHRSDDMKCPARGKSCLKCDGRIHFTRKCFASNRRFYKQFDQPTNNGERYRNSDKNLDSGSKYNLLELESLTIFGVF